MRTLLLLLALACGTTLWACHVPAHNPNYFADVSIMPACADLLEASGQWVVEIQTRYPQALVVFVHGNVDPGSGEWFAYPDIGAPISMYDLVDNLRVKIGPRRIILLACNPGRLPFDAPGVSYALNDVWITPDSFASVVGQLRDVYEPDVIGSIAEFTENP